jgi:hypothetical protein
MRKADLSCADGNKSRIRAVDGADRSSQSAGIRRDPFAVSRKLPEQVLSLARRLGAAEGRERSHVTLAQRGRFCGADQSRTVSFTAAQVIDLLEVGFFWRAKYGPWGLVAASDRLVNGVACRSFTALRVLPLFTSRSAPDLLWGERVRYLSELVWAPDAILSNPHLRWLPLDDRTLRVSAGPEPDSAHVTINLDALGRIEDVEAGSGSFASTSYRPAALPAGSVSRVSFSDYADVEGRSVPRKANSTCHVAGRQIAQWECEITKWNFR